MGATLRTAGAALPICILFLRFAAIAVVRRDLRKYQPDF